MQYNVIKFDTIDSTSLWARKNLPDLKHFDVISSDIQTLGHGQFERKWYSTSRNGGNVYLSIVLKPDNIERLNELTRYTSLIVAKVLETYGVKPDFKFPNDILINGKKISGILAESVFLGNEFKGVVVGIGINLNLDEEDVKNIDIKATSIFLETGVHVNKEEFINKLLTRYENEFDEFLISGAKELNYVNQ